MKKYITFGIVLAIFILIFVFRNKLMLLFSKASAAPPVPAVLPPATSGLDQNKVLKNGVYNSEEVKLLQTWLGVVADGDFGPITEAALLQKKGVAQITLAQYPSAPDLNLQNTDAPMTDAASEADHWYNHVPYGYIFG